MPRSVNTLCERFTTRCATLVRAGCPWRLLPNDLPPYGVVFQQAQRWIKAGVFEAMAHDLRAILQLAVGRNERPTAVVLDARTLQSSVESGVRAGYDGHKRKKGSKVHLAVDTLGHLLALHITAANEQERAQVGELAAQVQEATGESVALAYVDQGYSGEEPKEKAAVHGIVLEVVSHTEAKRGFVLLPKRWVVERSFAQAARFRRLARDYERLPTTLAGLHLVVFACLLLSRILSNFTIQSASHALGYVEYTRDKPFAEAIADEKQRNIVISLLGKCWENKLGQVDANPCG
jgi:transposase